MVRVETHFSAAGLSSRLPNKFTTFSHIRNPSASSDTDTTLSLALKQFDQQNDNYVFEIPVAARIKNGKSFKKIQFPPSAQQNGNCTFSTQCRVQRQSPSVIPSRFNPALKHTAILCLEPGPARALLVALPPQNSHRLLDLQVGQVNLRYIHK
jgi:hypothetical protein